MPQAQETLCDINHNLRAALLRLQDVQSGRSNIRASEFCDLRAENRRVAHFLAQELSSAEAAGLRKALTEYRAIAEQLLKILPCVQGRMLVEKARLEAARMHLSRAAAWAQARSTTL
jgi:hypothetical protein